MKRLAFVVALFVALSSTVVLAPVAYGAAKSKKAPAPAKPTYPLPADGVYNNFAWGMSLEVVVKAVTASGGKLEPRPTKGEYVQLQDVTSRTVYGLNVAAVMYSFYQGKLVGVTLLLQESKNVQDLRNLFASAKAAYGDGQILGQDESIHAIAVGYETKTGGFIVFAMAPEDTVKAQLVFVSAEEAKRQGEANKTSPAPAPAPENKNQATPPTKKNPLNTINI